MQRLGILIAFFVRAVAGATAQTGYYRSAKVDADGQLHIILGTGQDFLAPKFPDQKSFSSPLISDNHAIIGWLADWPDESSEYRASWATISYELDIYKKGHLLRRFTADPLGIWLWKFADGDRDVIFGTGFTHGGIIQCEWRNIKSGRLLGQWDYDEVHANYPPWMPPEMIEEARRAADSP